MSVDIEEPSLGGKEPISPNHVHDLVPPVGRNTHAAGSLVLNDLWPIARVSLTHCVSFTHCESVSTPPDCPGRKAGSFSRLQLSPAPRARNDLMKMAGSLGGLHVIRGALLLQLIAFVACLLLLVTARLTWVLTGRIAQGGFAPVEDVFD